MKLDCCLDRVRMLLFSSKPPVSGGFVKEIDMETEPGLYRHRKAGSSWRSPNRGRREATREEIIELLGGGPKAADHVIESLRRKGWLERASWGKYLLIPPEQGPDALGDSNLLALASRIADPYYIGYGTAAAHYGLTTQHRNVILLVTPVHLRDRRVGEVRVRIVNPAPESSSASSPVDVLGYKVMISDREKTAIDCIDRPELAGGVGRGRYHPGDRQPPVRLEQGGRISRTDRIRRARRDGSAGSPITSGPKFRRTCASACCGWPPAAARHGSDPIPHAGSAGRHRL